MSDYQIMPKL